jgi:hypothetical protein
MVSKHSTPEEESTNQAFAGLVAEPIVMDRSQQVGGQEGIGSKIAAAIDAAFDSGKDGFSKGGRIPLEKIVTGEVNKNTLQNALGRLRKKGYDVSQVKHDGKQYVGFYPTETHKLKVPE